MQKLGELSPSTTYWYRVHSANLDGENVVSELGKFTTAAVESEDEGEGEIKLSKHTVSASGEFVGYDEIEANGLSNACYMDEQHYLAEFLYQNPEACFWEVDAANRRIAAKDVPAVPADATMLPLPSGGDDTAALERVINANKGGAVYGTGTYIVNGLDVNVPVDIFDMPMRTPKGAGVIVRIKSPDVRIFNSPIDAEGSGTVYTGFYVDHGAHRFTLVGSGLSNVLHRRSKSASGVHIRGADDFHVACNTFVNIVNDTSDKTTGARANAIWMNGGKVHDTSGGIIANNYAEELQSNGRLSDAEFFTVQSYRSTDEKRPVRVYANRALNAGKRLTKHQESDALVLSNHYDWDVKQGPLGSRRLFSMVNVHFEDNVIARNNRLRVAADGRFDFIFHTNAKSRGIRQDNIHFDCNDIELVDRQPASSGTVSQIIAAQNSAEPDKSTAFEATNSSANHNVVRGTGSVMHYYTFGGGYRKDGGRFETIGNDFRVPAVRREYKYR